MSKVSRLYEIERLDFSWVLVQITSPLKIYQYLLVYTKNFKINLNLNTRLINLFFLFYQRYTFSILVIFVVEMAGKKANVELPENYLLDEADLARLRGIEKVLEVVAN